MPNLNGRQISDIFFLDSLTGWSVTNATNQIIDTTYVLKTTNGGDNWVIQYRKIQTGGGYYGLSKVYFLNQNTGYICGVDNGPVSGFAKSMDGGMSWGTINVPVPGDNYLDMSILNVDTAWLVTPEPLTGGVFHTTNGGANWIQQLAIGVQNPSRIYMYNATIGFIAKNGTGGYVKKTTDGGTSWFTVDSAASSGFTDIYFIDSLTGWRAFANMRKTTDGGLTWQSQIMPHGGNIITSTVSKFSIVNLDTIWGVDGQIQYPNFQVRGIIYKTTDGGNNWGFQIPDTSIHISGYDYIKFVTKQNGWAYTGSPGVHTVTGGDTVIYYGIQEKSLNIPKNYILKQNYPNPFNPRTVIPYSLKSAGYVRIIAYDILGREVQKLVDQKQSAGEYEVDFMGKFTATGVYFYRMTVDDQLIDTKKMILLK
jgi:photosystem II stability/assembly factor-like uncharacterized protein